MTPSKMPVILLSALLLIGCHMSLGYPVPDDGDDLASYFNKAKDAVKSGFDSANEHISKIGEDIKKSPAYEKAKEHLHSVGEQISKAGDSIKDSDIFKNAQDSFNKGVENIKDKLD